jgi:hypothetical protein
MGKCAMIVVVVVESSRVRKVAPVRRIGDDAEARAKVGERGATGWMRVR